MSNTAQELRTVRDKSGVAEVDVLIVGAGIAGLYAVHRLRGQGLTVQGIESASDVGGTWYHNRYPGARCDVESVDYSYSFSEELQQDWDWTELYATQPEILSYLQHVADRFDLRRSFRFDTRVLAAHYDESADRWRITTDHGDALIARFCVFATGPLSSTNVPNIVGLEEFGGTILHTGAWPHEGVDFTGQRVGVIGTGSSGIQSTPEIAAQAAELTVFQRTPNFSVPAGNRPIDDAKRAEQKANYAERRRLSRLSGGGSPFTPNPHGALDVSAEERERIYEHHWTLGGVLFSKAFADQMRDDAANETARAFVERKIRELVDDPSIADLLVPTDHPIGTKRIVTDAGYFETFNRENVHLVNLREDPIVRIDETGIKTETNHHALDAIVFATGFDAVTGALDRIDIRGRDGHALLDAWSQGVRSYLGLTVHGFPNLFTVTGPGSPGVLANMVLGSEQHIDWIGDAIAHLDAQNLTTIEPAADAEDEWMAECAQLADQTLFPRANSWYMGANIPGKPRRFMMYIGGFGTYGKICAKVAAAGYKGFEIR